MDFVLDSSLQESTSYVTWIEVRGPQVIVKNGTILSGQFLPTDRWGLISLNRRHSYFSDVDG